MKTLINLITLLDTQARIAKARKVKINYTLKKEYELKHIKKAKTMLPKYKFFFLEGVGRTLIRAKHCSIVIWIMKERCKHNWVYDGNRKGWKCTKCPAED